MPIKVDYSDVYDVMAFFVGMPNGQGSHDSLAQKIGEAGRQWAKDYWRYADMACVEIFLLLGPTFVSKDLPETLTFFCVSSYGPSAYMYRLSLEYVRILHHDEGDVDYVEMPSFNL